MELIYLVGYSKEYLGFIEVENISTQEWLLTLQ